MPIRTETSPQAPPLESAEAGAPAPAADPAAAPLLAIRDLAVSFEDLARAGAPRIQAVAGASMTIHPRQILAVVGESGCGKSVTAMSTMRLLPSPPCRHDRGEVRFEGRDLMTLSEREMLAVRGGAIAMIFQEPMTSLNPVYTVGEQIVEAILLHQRAEESTAREIALQAMGDVGIADPGSRIDQYPHQFSGGMRQRIMIAMALACRPRLLLADEPTTALDVTIQAQILDLLDDLRRTRGMSIMLITHNLGVVAENADVVCVMYAGRVVEYASVFDLFDRPLHPYTRGLFGSIPEVGRRRTRLTTVADVVSDPAEFRALDRGGAGVVPWWPEMPPPPGLVRPDRAKGESPGPGWETIAVEVEPRHWVGCWRTEEAIGRGGGPPDIAFRR
ncbi:MAG TPA: ABC transporter ATP-binding protein [Phycisphaerales bacterium]|nr:ABC transporter ATP-binding protein [Phycisphaerales bacterium]HMP35963.1 ABC transporter ATP-binding protein [Phycisphaerales bacterium]